MRSNGCLSVALTNTLMFRSACFSCSVKVTDEASPGGPCGANDVGGTTWEEGIVSFANSLSVELSLDARMGRYPRSVFVWPPKGLSATTRE